MLKSISTLVLNKSIVTAGILTAAIILLSLPSCKRTEDCGAYQGSGKTTRSFKSKKHHSEMIVAQPVFKA